MREEGVCTRKFRGILRNRQVGEVIRAFSPIPGVKHGTQISRGQISNFETSG